MTSLEFGRAPAGKSCHPRVAAYVVVKNDSGHVATVGVAVDRRERLWLPGGGLNLLRKIAEIRQYFFARDELCWYHMAAH